MAEKSSNQMATSSKGAVATMAMDAHPLRRRMFQNFLLIWMDGNIDESKEECQSMLTELRGVVNNINIFQSPDECVDFLSEVDGEKAFMIIADTIAEQIIPLIHEMPQLNTIYIICDNEARYAQWPTVWTKVKGVYTQITPIYEALQHSVQQYYQDSIAVSFVTVEEGILNQNLDRLDPSFMYTQIFKEILLAMKYDRKSIEKFSTYCRNADYGALGDINRFEVEYDSHPTIWWYTWPSFIYALLNEALRTLEADTIINMGFFLHDLHRQIEQLHKKQVGSYHGQTFTVYRGQGLWVTDFDKLQKTKGGLMSFNNFLSTSKDREVSLGFAIGALTSTEMVGILFKMIINPSLSSTPFAAIDELSYFRAEEEVLFSMHTVFRIGEIKKIDNNNRLYQVELQLTADDDQELRTLTKRIQEEADGCGWDRLGSLLLTIGQFNKAEELYTVLLDQISNEDQKANCYNKLGYAKYNQGDYENAVWYYEKAVAIQQKTLASSHPGLAISYNNIALVYDKMGEYSKALSSHEKSLEIKQKTLPENHLDLANSYNNVGGLYRNMGEYSKALTFLEKALEIQQKTLPRNHPDLANSYNNVGELYRNMGEYSKALTFLEKALEIQQKTLPPNHPDLSISYNNVGELYRNIGEYSKALTLYEKSLEIQRKTFPLSHPGLATPYSNIGSVYCDMGEYSKALSFYQKALEIQQKTFPPNHPDLANSYSNIGELYRNMREYSKALTFYKKALEIQQKSLPPNHPDLAISYGNFGELYRNTREYSKALTFYEKALEIQQETVSPNHPDLATLYNNIGFVYRNMGHHSKALTLFEKALEIQQKTLPHDHPDLAGFYKNIAFVYGDMGNHSKALSFLERALDIWQRSLSPNHPHTQDVRKCIETVKKML